MNLKGHQKIEEKFMPFGGGERRGRGPHSGLCRHWHKSSAETWLCYALSLLVQYRSI